MFGGNSGQTDSNEGVDGSGCVRVEIDATQRIVDVSLSTRWREIVGPDNLRNALLEAYGSAIDAGRTGNVDDDAAVPLPTDEGPDVFRGLPAEAMAEAFRRIAELGAAVNAETANRAERLRETRDQTYVGTDERHRVTVTVHQTGGADFDFDRKWLESTYTQRVVDALKDALRVAYDAYDAEYTPTETPATTQFRNLASDRYALRQWLTREV